MQQHLLSQPPVASAPAFDVPAGACDCHAHVFGPYERFPLAQDRTYTPPECSADTYLAMLDTIGFARGVLVQGSAHGTDNRAMLHALSRAPDRLRGVVVLDRSASYDDLVNMHRQGVRGLRFNRAHGANRFKSVIDVSELSHLAPSMRRAGLHAQLWIDAHELHELEPLIRAAKLPIVIDHFGKFVTERGLDDRSFVLLCRLLPIGYGELREVLNDVHGDWPGLLMNGVIIPPDGGSNHFAFGMRTCIFGMRECSRTASAADLHSPPLQKRIPAYQMRSGCSSLQMQ